MGEDRGATSFGPRSALNFYKDAADAVFKALVE